MMIFCKTTALSIFLQLVCLCLQAQPRQFISDVFGDKKGEVAMVGISECPTCDAALFQFVQLSDGQVLETYRVDAIGWASKSKRYGILLPDKKGDGVIFNTFNVQGGQLVKATAFDNVIGMYHLGSVYSVYNKYSMQCDVENAKCLVLEPYKNGIRIIDASLPNDPLKPRVIFELKDRPEKQINFHFSRSGRYVYCTGLGIILDLQEQKTVFQFKKDNNPSDHIVPTFDGGDEHMFIEQEKPNSIAVINLSKGRLIKNITIPDGLINISGSDPSFILHPTTSHGALFVQVYSGPTLDRKGRSYFIKADGSFLEMKTAE